MSAQIIDGKSIAKSIKDELAIKVSKLQQEGKRTPGLAVILVGENPASKIYVGSKSKSCEEVGFISKLYEFPDSITETALLDHIENLNNDPSIDGILVQ